MANNKKQLEEMSAVPEYKLPLVWIDLEMTGRIHLSFKIFYYSTSYFILVRLIELDDADNCLKTIRPLH